MAVLYIRNSSGEFEGVQSLNGKTAYQAAKEGGYTGTESEFNAKLAQEIPTALPNPQPITLNGQRYNGSEAVTLTTGDLGAATKEEVSQLKDNKLDKTGTAADSDKLGGQLPEHYATAQSVNQLKNDVATITPDDTVVDGKPWTSKKTVDSLCMPLKATGNPVQVYPVEGYPLGVKVSWEPTQAGSGDPRPDNVRTISGRDDMRVTRCGKNLVEHKYAPGYTVTKNGVTFTVNDGYSITVNGTATAEVYFDFFSIKGEDLIATYMINAMGMTKVINGFEIRDIVVQPYPSEHQTRLYLVIPKGAVVDTTYYPTIVYGATATPYEPYTGSKTDITLPETVYGGTLDLETGVVTVRHYVITFSGEENWIYTSDGYFHVRDLAPNELKPFSKDGYEAYDNICTHYLYKVGYSDNAIFLTATGHVYCGKGLVSNYESLTDFKTYLAAQYAAGTPVQICYKLAEPYTIQLTPQQISALSGVNTLYTDAGTLTVTGREDPRHTIVTLTDRIAALESAAAGV